MFTRGGRLTTKTMAAATSSGCIAPSFSTCSRVNSRTFSSLICSWISVAVAPGSMMHTRMPARVTSARSDSLNAVSANLLAA